jgi:hypothetical protein
MARGLANLSPERRRQIAQKGAAALHRKKKAHRFTPAEAKAAAEKRHQEAENVTSRMLVEDLQIEQPGSDDAK